jgi:serine/threonine protein kinase
MPAPVIIDEFLDLVRKSGLVDDNSLTPYLARLHTEKGLPAEPAKIATLFIRDGLLTYFQVEQFLQGKWRGFTIGNYRVLERLGAGMNASVYLCQHSRITRLVAIKVLPAARADDPLELERFYHHEARALAGLDHPNIVRGYDIDQEDKLHFLVMEYVDGSSLHEIIKKSEPMDPIRVAHYLRQAALGLQHAHETGGLVHGDIKPGDILVDRAGVVKIIDMGAARFCPGQEDILTDIYSLGCTFYFCLTGRSPFPESTVAQRSWQQERTATPIRQLRPAVPEELAALIQRMIARDPAQRPQTASEVADSLALWTAAPIGPPPEGEMPRRCLAVRNIMQAGRS